MLNSQNPPQIPLPKGWKKHVRSGILHVLSLDVNGGRIHLPNRPSAGVLSRESPSDKWALLRERQPRHSYRWRGSFSHKTLRSDVGNEGHCHSHDAALSV